MNSGSTLVRVLLTAPPAGSSATNVKLCSQVSSFPLSAMFGMCSLFLVLASICQRRLDVLTRKERVTQSDAQEASTLLSASTAADADKALTSV